ncbi:B12-binding domain-containing protein [Egicoccus sp. AB-alg2]|uniref:cobalamin B12-binding domain-containing protein n=1 Tax=Egicoccus sp. AB-alg2 TaxID=3242693 RepID=UPI00359EC0E1
MTADPRPSTEPVIDLSRHTQLDDRQSALVATFVELFSLADRHGAAVHARELLTGGRDADEIREALALAQRHVGELWQAGHWTITQEHAATAVAEAVLATLDETVDDRPAVGRVAIAAADGEWHALPARLAGHAFSRVGLETVFLGAGLPAGDVARTLPALQVDALAVSVTMPSNLTGAARTVAAGHSAGLPVLLGGGASSPQRARALGAEAHASSVQDGAQTVLRWIEEGARATGTPALRSAETDAMRRRRTVLLDEAFSAAEERWHALDEVPDDLLDHVIEDLEQLYDHLVAAVLVDEPPVFTSLVPWLTEVHAGRGLPPALLEIELESLDTVLGEHPEARTLVRDARSSGAGD